MTDAARSSPPSPEPPAPAATLPLSPSRRRAGLALAATAVVALGTALASATKYEVHDPDSQLYVALSSELAARPLAQWCAPEWNGHWYHQGRFYEHPPGLFWAGAALGRAGLAPYPALYFVNFVALLASLALVAAIGRKLGGDLVGLAAPLAWALTPMFIQYLVRGNQEHPLTTFVLAAVLALVVLERPIVRTLVFGLALSGAVMVKGAAGLAVLPLAGVVWWLRGRRRTELLELAGGLCILAIACIGLEAWHRAITGASFWASYLTAQVRVALGGVEPLRKLVALFFYACRPLWFFFPWIAVVLWAVVRWARGREPVLDRPGFVLGVVALAVYVVGFSVGHRKADRYLMPVYPLLAVSVGYVFAHVEHRRLAGIRRLLERGRSWLPYALLGAIVVGIGIKVWVGLYHYTYIQIWRGF